MENRMIISIHTPFIRLDALLKLSALAETGGHAKEMILEGEVMVDGKVVLQRGKKVYPGSSVSISGSEESLQVQADTEG